MERVNLPEFCDNLPRYIASDETITAWCIYEDTEVNYSGDDCDLEACKELGIPAYHSRDDGGCIVNFKGTINIADFRKAKEWVFHAFCKDFAEWLKGKGLNAEYDTNDVLIDGYKVASGFGYNLAPDYQRQYTGLGMFFNSDPDIIRRICKKPMDKEPKGLEQYGITTDDCVEFMEAWFEKYDKE